MDTDNSAVEAWRGAGVRGRWSMGIKGGTTVILSTIKIKMF